MNSHLWAYFWGPAAGDSSFTATAALTRGGATFAASATFTGMAGTFEGTAALTRGGAEFAASATFTAPVFDATAALTRAGATFSATALYKVYTATAALTRAGATFAASATFTAPVFDATAALVRGGAEFSALVDFSTATFAATAALTRAGATFAASAAFAPGTKTASAALVRAAAEFAATATFTGLTFTATVAVTRGAAVFAGSATFTTDETRLAVMVKVAQGITNAINAVGPGLFTYDVTAVRSWADWDTDQCESTTLQVDVVPAGIEDLELDDREPQLAYRVQTDIGVRQRFGQADQAEASGRIENSKLDRLALLTEQLHEHFCADRLADYPQAVWVQTEYRAGYIRKHLRELRQWTSIVRVTHDYTKVAGEE